jgi:hypothetical protein
MVLRWTFRAVTTLFLLSGIPAGLLQLVPGACAADISLLSQPKEQGERWPVLLNGTIQDGDLAKLIKIAGDRDVKVVFNSDGGSFAEAIKIARHLNDNFIPSEIGAGQRCFSACAIAFLGGADHGIEGTTATRRKLHPQGRLGFHAPFLEMPDEKYQKDVVEVAYELAIRNIADLISLTKELGVDPKLLPLLLQGGRQKFYEVDRVDKAGVLKIEIDHDARLGQFSPRMLFNYCRNGYAWWGSRFEAEFFKQFIESSDHPLNRSVSYRAVLAGKERNVTVRVRERGKDPQSEYINTHVALAIGHVLPEGVDEMHFCAITIQRRPDGRTDIYCTGIYTHETKGGLENTLRLMEAHTKNFEDGKPDALCYPPAGDYAFLPADTPISEVPRLLDLYKQRLTKGRGADAPVNK